ncbi:hypothetical protein PF002_g33381 [Phytophthora fragariae]|uniref:Uncharacterized protein n=1 Tax=Phytophthora fragariae TaxID=53985 RepID=A0A6A3UZU8_9STRA|nr:hypothetical protein PF003_g22680 [Phytophthora fragariae]KAE9157388.1 hypothetical protein PF002_g33381 [Phytophthora fragariae]
MADLFQRIIANIRANERLPNDVTPVPKARHLSHSKPHLFGSAVAPTVSGGDGALQAATRQQQSPRNGRWGQGAVAGSSRPRRGSNRQWERAAGTRRGRWEFQAATQQQQAVGKGGGDAARSRGATRQQQAVGTGGGDAARLRGATRQQEAVGTGGGDAARSRGELHKRCGGRR